MCIRPLQVNATMSETIQLHQTNLEATDSMAQFESPDGDAICASYVSRQVADELGEYAEVTVSDEADVTAELDGVSGSGTGNYAIYETAGGAVTGLYVSHEALESLHDGEPTPENAPDSIGLVFAASDEESWEAANEDDEASEEEIEGLLGGDDSGESSDEEEVEISDEELSLVEE